MVDVASVAKLPAKLLSGRHDTNEYVEGSHRTAKEKTVPVRTDWAATGAIRMPLLTIRWLPVTTVINPLGMMALCLLPFDRLETAIISKCAITLYDSATGRFFRTAAGPMILGPDVS
jgi:hypothetical protein